VYDSAPVGRAEVIERLERVLNARGRALLTGSAGVGKTEVAMAIAARAEARGETVLWLATLPTDRDIPGATAAALVATVSAFADEGIDPDAGSADAHPRVTGILDGLPGPQRGAVAMLCREAPIPDGGWDPIALRMALARVLRTLAERGPVLLIVDGAQRMDADSAGLLRFALHLAPSALRVISIETPEADAGTAGPEPLWVPS
jgi:hypothetical protein